MNSRAGFPTYTLSRGASSANLSTSPEAVILPYADSLLLSLDVVITKILFLDNNNILSHIITVVKALS